MQLPGQRLRFALAGVGVPAVILLIMAAAIHAGNEERLRGTLGTSVDSSPDLAGWLGVVGALLLVAVAALPLTRRGAEALLRRGHDDIRKSLLTRYGIEVRIVWPRLLGVLDADDLRQVASQGRQAVWTVGVFFGLVVADVLALLMMAFVANAPDIAWLVPGVALALAAGQFFEIRRAAHGYGRAVVTVLELHRFKLLRSLHLPLPRTNVEERQVFETLVADGKRTVEYDHLASEGQATTSEIRDAVASAFSSRQLANWSGWVVAWIESTEGERVGALAAARPYVLKVEFSTSKRDDDPGGRIEITDGRDEPEVRFELAFDSSAIKFPPSQLTAFVPADRPSAPTEQRFEAPEREGSYELWIQILQRNRLVQVLPMTVNVT
jgi:hypothetical protein